MVMVYVGFIVEPSVKAGHANVALGRGTFAIVLMKPMFWLIGLLAFGVVLWEAVRCTNDSPDSLH